MKTESLKIIEGVFNTEDAKDILMNLFYTKIRYHEMRDFSSLERFGKPDPFANKRISELKSELNKLNNILSMAQSSEANLQITSEIQIQIAQD